MSLDESGFVYVIVLTEGADGVQRHAVWVLTPQGERLMDVTLPEMTDYSPPIVGYNHQVYILLEDRILAISSEGDVLWNEGAGGPIAGAVVTADGQLVVAAGSLIVAFDAAGERSVLYYEEGTQWMTPPVLTERQRLFIASQQHLYCLQLKP
jgi:sugar lactone lactonase YvrE